MGVSLAKLLVSGGLVGVGQIREALERQRELGYGLGGSLAELGYVSEPHLVEFLGRQCGVPVISLDDYVVEQKAADLIPKETALEKCLIPLSASGSDLSIAMADPSDILLLDDLSFLTGKNIKPAVASERSIKLKISEIYGGEDSENDPAVDSPRQPARENISNPSSADKEKHERSIDEVITELEQYIDNRLSPGNLSGKEELAGDLRIDTGDGGAQDEAALPGDSFDPARRIAGEEHEPDLNIYGDDDNGVNTPLPESGENVSGDTDDVEEGAFADSALETEGGEMFDVFAQVPPVAESDVGSEESDSEIRERSETDTDEGYETVYADLFRPSDPGGDTEHAAGFTSAFNPQENKGGDEKRFHGVEEHEASDGDSVPDSDDYFQPEGVGETADVSSGRKEPEYDPFAAPPKDSYAGDDSHGSETREVSWEFVSDEGKEPGPFESGSPGHGSGETQDSPGDADSEEQREAFSIHPLSDSSADEDPLDGTATFTSGELREDASGNLSEDEAAGSGPLELTSSIFGDGESEELNAHEDSSAEEGGFSAPAVDTSREPREPAGEEPPSPDEGFFLSTEESFTEAEEKVSGAEAPASLDSGEERAEERDESQDSPLGVGESPSAAFISHSGEGHAPEHPEHPQGAEPPVDSPLSEPAEQSPPEATVFESPVLKEGSTNGTDEKGSVLVVDGSPTVRKIMSITLGRRGYRVYTAGDGIEALARLNEVTPDLIFVDVKLPHMDGYQLCRIIKSHGLTKDIPVVMTADKVGILDRMKWKRAGARNCITKPFDPRLIIETAVKYCS